MTEQEFVARERNALHAFMNKHATDDFTGRTLPVYTKQYTCECGFRTTDTRAVYRHAMDECKGKAS